MIFLTSIASNAAEPFPQELASDPLLDLTTFNEALSNSFYVRRRMNSAMYDLRREINLKDVSEDSSMYALNGLGRVYDLEKRISKAVVDL